MIYMLLGSEYIQKDWIMFCLRTHRFQLGSLEDIDFKSKRRLSMTSNLSNQSTSCKDIHKISTIEAQPNHILFADID